MNDASSPGDPRSRFRLWCALVIVAAAILSWRVHRGVEIDSNILHLLPATERDPVVEEIVEQFAEAGATRSVFLIGGLEPARSVEAGDRLAASLRASPVFREVQFRVADDVGAATYELYFPHRYAVLSKRMQDVLAAPDAAEEIVAHARRTMYAPVATFNSSLLERDPLFFFSDFVEGLAGAREGWTIVDGAVVIEHDDAAYAMVTAVAHESAFSREAQRTVTPVVSAAIEEVQGAFPGAQVLRGGALKFATEAAGMAEREASIIGIGSIIGVVLLMVSTFRSLRQLTFGMCSLAVAFLFAATATFVAFERVHLVTLGFGASLLGVCIDYSFHYFSEGLEAPEAGGPSVLRRVFAAISFGALTSGIGYGALSLAPFPGLRQMTVFSCFGLLGAYLTVCCLYPRFQVVSPRASPPLLLRLSTRMIRRLDAIPPARAVAGLLLIAACSLPALGQLQVDDDIRALQASSPSLRDEEDRVRAVVQAGDFSRFFVVEGRDAQEVLEREVALRVHLDALVARGHLGAYFAVSSAVPPASEQRRQASKLATALDAGRPAVTAYFEEVGMGPRASQGLWSALEAAPAAPLEVTTWMESPASFAQRDLWVGTTSRGVASVVMLSEVRDASGVLAITAPGVSYVDKVSDISQLLRRYRTKAARLVALAYLAIFVFLVARYGVRLGVCASVPSILAALSVFGVFGYAGFALNIFHMLGLLLVLGISVDYAIFFAESRASAGPTLLAVALSGVTTLLSFGLLAWSETPFLHGFGSAVLIGICVAFLTAPIAVRALGKS